LWSCFWGSCYVWVNPLWRVRMTGRRKIPWRRPCILVSNHQSMVDIVVLYQLFAPYKWVSKKENFKIPILGWQMRLNQYLEIDRGKRDSLLRLMNEAAKNIKKGNSLLIFPEGTRYPGGILGPFREGAFKMALDNQVDIVPIVLDGTAKALPKKGVILTGFANIRARVLDPIPYSSFAGKSSRELSMDIRGLMEKEYTRLWLLKKGEAPD
ncbi:lysophospholipid acyltransferase family protein, partial [Bacteroidota bacterium]